MFEVALNYHRGKWEWRVYDRSGIIVLQGWEKTHLEAKDQADRGLLLLLKLAKPSGDANAER